MGFVKHAFVLAFYCLLRVQTMPVEDAFDYAMEQIAMLAGDTDTNCAIVGGLVGAYTGIDNIDKEKIRKVLDCDLDKGGQPRRPDHVKPMIDGFDCIKELIAIAPAKLEIVEN